MVRTIFILFTVFLFLSACNAQDAKQNIATENIQQDESNYASAKRTLKIFEAIKKGMTYAQIEEIAGKPDTNIGSGIYIFVYKLSEGSEVWIGFANLDKPLLYVKHMLIDGSRVDVLS
jgi:hypothetical protein